MRDRVKRCYGCQTDRPLGSFNKDSQRKDGLQSKCRECQKAYMRVNKAQHAKTMADWYDRNREKVAVQGKEYRARTPEYQKAKAARWVRENPEKNRAKRARRRAREIGSVDYALILNLYGPQCHLCEEPIDLQLRFPDRESLVYEHVIPLAKGGPHDNSNVRPAHNICNLKKGTNAR